MAGRPTLNTSNLPAVREDAASATASPARGTAMKVDLLKRLRAPPLVHSWVFWHDKSSARTDAQGAANASYEDRLVDLCEMSDVREFWEMFNNFDVSQLKMRDSVHLFHKGVKPVWEDPRNQKGGCWTFRVTKADGPEFWKELCMLAIGEQLQEAVKTNRISFNDDICGISLSARYGSMLISVWHRDSSNENGIARLKQVVTDNVSENLIPKTEDKIYYKKHAAHSGFNKAASTEQTT